SRQQGQRRRRPRRSNARGSAMNDQAFALKLEGIFRRVQENLAGQDFRLMRYDPDRNVYLLVVAGEQAQLTHNLFAAVSKYAHTLRAAPGDKEAAKRDMVAALEELASKLNLAQ